MKRMAVVLALAAILSAACSGGSKRPAPTALPGSQEATEAAPSPSPPAGTTTPPPVPAIGIDWSHRLAVYTAQVGVERETNRVLPKRAVVTWDLDVGKLAASFGYTAPGEYAVGAALAGRDIVFATDARVVRAHLDGTDQQVLLKAGEGNLTQDIRVSPDGRMLAVVVSPADILQPGTLRVLDLQSGSERLRVDQSDGRFTGMRGHFSQVQWRDDGGGVLVGTATHTEMHGSLATIFLDGRVRLEDVQGYGNVSPTGRLWAGDVGGIGCMFIGSHEFVIRDLDAGKILVRARGESTVYTPWEWSPDGSEFVFMQQEATTCDQLSADNQVAYVVKMDGGSFGAPARVRDLSALHRQWYGDRLFTTGCASGREPAVDRLAKPILGCMGSGGGPDAVRTVAVGGRPAGATVAPAPVGVIDPGVTPKQ